MLLYPRKSESDHRLLLEVLLAEGLSLHHSDAQAPLSLDGFRDYLWETNYGKGHGLDHCLGFLEWLSDYSFRFFNQTPDVQKRSPSPRGNTLTDVPDTGANPDTAPPDRQPLRSAVDYCRLRYLNPGAPMDLRMQLGVRDTCLTALDRTTHPDAFTIAAHHCRRRLVAEAIPEYMALACRNANRYAARVRYVWSAFAILLSLVAVFLTVHFNLSRWTRIGLLPIVFTALLTIASARYALCVFRHLRRVRDSDGYTDDLATDKENQLIYGRPPILDLENGMRPPAPLHTVVEEDEECEKEEESKKGLQRASTMSSVETAVAKPQDSSVNANSNSTGAAASSLGEYVEIQVTDEKGTATVVDVAETGGRWKRWQARKQNASIAATAGSPSIFNDNRRLKLRSSLVRRQQRYLLLRIALTTALPVALLFIAGTLIIPESIRGITRGAVLDDTVVLNPTLS
ncbi:hypothetical protein THASP1DRAFT_22916 [Thamnocephalis sphaerospora]|uniref:RGS domain-containing protein n=1 Tax=Thamnocephalis sphaerospora TaxID=78915 RepID=A0A4P9XSV4_9FUNG|nr:hypothetical protein THASP1DRAFT_22916 [Thamnocephalis sphaerospora]|eukprot:RKP09217.1 hypothetical protein THASP1DRAFT_22916 [Thamnocephalis sphaerospora]